MSSAPSRFSVAGLAGILAVVLYASSAPAEVDPPAPPATATTPATGAPDEDDPPVVRHAKRAADAPGDDVRFQDAHADRVIFGSTAETHPKGTFFFTDYELLLLEFGYAVTDQLQLTLTGLPPIVKDQPYFFDFGVKLNLVRGDVFRAALTGAFDVVTVGGTGTDTGPFYGGRLGAVGQFCFERTCRSSVSITAGTLLTSGVKQVLPVYGAVGFVANVSPLVSVLAEPELLGALGTGQTDISSGAFLAMGYGVRLARQNFGLDLTLIKPVAATTGAFQDPFILGYPFVVFTYRTDGDARGQSGQSASGMTHAGAGLMRR